MTPRQPPAPQPRILQGKTNTAPPWEPAPVTAAELTAIQSLVVGKATDTQQRLVVKWLEKATAYAELEFRPSDERASCFAAGKRFVGLQFFTLAQTFIPDRKNT